MNRSWIKRAANGLANQGWFCEGNLVEQSLLDGLNRWASDRLAAGDFRDAGIGKSERLQKNSEIRRDRILWLPDESNDELICFWKNWIETIRDGINQELFAGLESFEGHLAIYPPGGFYRRHVDTFRDDDARRITLILYLNDQWTPRDGGELRLYCSASDSIDIKPRGGTVVLFNSRELSHEVLKSNAERRSFTGWFKVRNLSR